MSYYYNDDFHQVEFADLQGKTIVGILTDDDMSEMRIRTTDGHEYIMVHEQDCCEGVYIESVVGDLADLIGEVLLCADEAISNENPEGYAKGDYQDSFTWTFYKMDTVKGGVTIRWYGESNGYYSESVTLYRTRYLPEVEEPPEPDVKPNLSVGVWT